MAGLAGMGLLLSLGPVSAQGNAPRTLLRMAPRVLVEVDVETPLLINVGPTEALPANSYVQLRGLPDSASLNEGHSISPGTWAVPLRSLGNLTIQAPPAATGTTDFTVRVMSLEGEVLAETKSAVIVVAGYVIGQRTAAGESAAPRIVQPPAPATQPQSASPPAAAVRRAPQVLAAPILRAVPPSASVSPAPVPVPPATAPQAPPASTLTADDRAKLERFVGLGNRHLASGNIAAAREFYRKAAEGGLADGAMLLATTYDPAELEAIKVQGLTADPAEARKWYERARALGAAGVEARLARLGAR